MHRALGFLSKRIAHVRRGEARKVWLTFLYFFLALTAYYLIKPASRALALGLLGSRFIPHLDLIAVLLLAPLAALSARLGGRLAIPAVFRLSCGAILGTLLAFWQLLAQPVPLLAGLFYVWSAVVSMLVVGLFWLVANELYRPQEMKRLFSLIGSGGVLGGLAGSSLAAVAAPLLGTRHLLLLASAALLACWGIVQLLWRGVPAQTGVGVAALPPRPVPVRPPAGAAVPLLVRSRYLLLLAGVVGLGKLVSTLVYYQCNPFIERAFTGVDAQTTFFGLFFGGMNVAAFLVQFFCTSWVLRRWGPSVGLLALPLGVLAGTTGLLFAPALGLAAAVELYDGSMHYSLQQTTKELLYLPIDRSVRGIVKPFIDTAVFRIGKGLAAVIGIAGLGAAGLAPNALGLLIVPLVMAWLVIALWLRHEYVATIRTMLQARAAVLRPPAEGPGEAESSEPEPFGSLTDGQPSDRKLVLLGRLLEATAASSPAGHELLESLTAYELRLAGPLEIDGHVQRLKALVGDHTEPMAKRRRALRSLARTDQQEAADFLVGLMVAEPEVLLRQEALVGLVKLRLRGARLSVPASLIRRQVAREVAHCQRIRRVVAIYRRHHTGLSADDPIRQLLHILLEESVEQVFRCLMLLYRPEEIHLIYEQMQASELYVRSDALELLDNLVDPAMRAVLLPLLDEEGFLTGTADDADAAQDTLIASRLLQAAIWDRHRWLSVATLCVAGRMRLSALQPELERASRHAAPVISAAARVALHLATAA